MNKIDLIKTLSTTIDISKTEATRIVNQFFDQMTITLEIRSTQVFKRGF